MPTPISLYRNDDEPFHITRPLDCQILGHAHVQLSLCSQSIELGNAKRPKPDMKLLAMCPGCMKYIQDTGKIDPLDCETYETQVALLYAARDRREITEGCS